MRFSALCIVGLTALLLAKPSLACTIIAVGRDASASGSPIVCHTDDSGLDTTDFRFVRVPRQTWPAGSMRPLYLWADGYPRVVSAARSPEYAPVAGQRETQPIGHIPQVAETFAYWDMDYGVQNEKGLSIGESTCTARTVGWPATPDRPYGYNRAGIEDLSKIALERCSTARCAVTTMGAVAVEQGFYSADSGDPAMPSYDGSSETLVLADALPGEVWIFNVMTGRNNASAIWAAQRVPPNHIAAVGDTFTIRQMDLSDPENFLYSPGVTELAEEMGWWSPHDGPFDFFGVYGFQPPEAKTAADPAAAFALSKNLMYYSGRRMWRIFSLLSPQEGAKLDPEKGNLPKTHDPYPASVLAPHRAITAQMVMSVLRDHYEGTPYDLTKGMAAGPFGSPNRGPTSPAGVFGRWERAISMHRGSWSYVLEPKPGNRSLAWLGYDSPHGTAYLPFFGAAAAGAPLPYREGCQSQFNRKSAWWAFNSVNQYSDLNFGLINRDVRARASEVEEEARRSLVEWQAEADQLGNASAALELLTRRSNAFAEAKVAEWWEFGGTLMAKFARYVITHNESSNGESAQVYPRWWLENPQVGFTSDLHSPYSALVVDRTIGLVATVPSAAALMPMLVLASGALAGIIGYRAGFRRALHESSVQDMYVAQP